MNDRHKGCTEWIAPSGRLQVGHPVHRVPRSDCRFAWLEHLFIHGCDASNPANDSMAAYTLRGKATFQTSDRQQQIWNLTAPTGHSSSAWCRNSP